jgi:PLP dependent protein
MHLAEELNRRCEQASRTMPILLEVNVAGEASKFGYAPARLLEELAALNALPRIEIHGLMTIAPYTTVAEKARPFFRELAGLRKRCENQLGVPLPQLSMGMSGDFEVAIEEGATLVRIGTSLFGSRQRAGA